MMCRAACLLTLIFGSLLVNSDSGFGFATTGSARERMGIWAKAGAATATAATIRAMDRFMQVSLQFVLVGSVLASLPARAAGPERLRSERGKSHGQAPERRAQPIQREP